MYQGDVIAKTVLRIIIILKKRLTMGPGGPCGPCGPILPGRP